jgi:hypothetical protein
LRRGALAYLGSERPLSGECKDGAVANGSNSPNSSSSSSDDEDRSSDEDSVTKKIKD